MHPLVKICQKIEFTPISRATRSQIRWQSLYSGSSSRQRQGECGSCQNQHKSLQARYISNKRQPSTLRPRSILQSKTPQKARIIKDFLDLPASYTDEGGLPFRDVPLTKKEVLQVFGTDVEMNSANVFMRRLHGRRVAGTLNDPNLLDLSADHERVAHARALDWLREHVPVDEVENAALRAEKELSEMDEEVLRDAERLGLYEPNAQDASKQPGGVYGQGVFEKMRAENKERLDKIEEERKSQADEIRENTGTLTTVDSYGNRALARPDMSERMKYWQEQGMVTQGGIAPEMSTSARLWPSGLLLVVTCGLAYGFAIGYEPPTKGTRLWPDMPASAATIVALIAMNTAIFLAWRVPPLWRSMNKYFLQVPAYPYAFSLLGSIFSHQSLRHITFNMLVLFLAGTRLHEEVGRGNFLAIYMASGAIGSMASLTVRVLANSFITSSLGASGAICGIIGCYLLLHSEEKVTILGVFPPPDWPSMSSMMLLSLFIGFEIFGLARQRIRPTSTDHWAHLGGFAAGIGSAYFLRDEMRKRKERDTNRKKTFMERIKGGRF